MENYNFIEYYDYSLSKNKCERFIKYFHDNPDLTKDGSMYNAEKGSHVNKEFKDSKDLSSYNMPGQFVHHYLEETISSCVSKYVSKYRNAGAMVPFSARQFFNMQWYPPGAGFKQWHCEVACNPEPERGLRHLVFMTYLNTVEDGGTEFQYQNLTLDAVQGRTVIWPSMWTHFHRGVVSQTRDKYILTGWLNFEK